MSEGTIIYIGGFELPDKNAAAHRVINNGKILKKLGYNVIFIGINRSSENVMSYRIIQGFKCWSVSYPNSKKEWIRYLIDISDAKRIIANAKNVKMVICYNYQSVALLRLRRYCKNNSIKIIADCTEWYGVKGENIVFKFIKGLDVFLRMNIIHKSLDGLIVISAYLKNYYKNYQKHLLLLPPLVDKSEDKWHSQKQKSDNRIHFVYVGSPGKIKDNINMIINAFSKLEHRNYMVHFVGITKEDYLKNIGYADKNLCKIEKNVEFVGRISHEEGIKYYIWADYSIFLRELNRVNMAGFPTKFVESISCNTKVITNGSSDLSEYIIEGVNGYIVNINDDSLEILLNSILNENLENNNNGFNSYIFDYHNYLDKTSIFIKQILLK